MKPATKAGYVSTSGPFFDELWAEYLRSPEAQSKTAEELARLTAEQADSRRKPGGKYRR